MSEALFRFASDAGGGDQFTVVSFSASEAISSPYRYEIEIKAPLAAAIVLDDVLDNPARFVTELDGQEYPVYGVLAGFDELQTVLGFVYYRALLVPRLWSLSIYRTNEIYTEEKTVDVIIQTVLENAGFTDGNDFDLNGLEKSRFLERDYVCQFGESDLDFISRLMEREGIFYYFDHGDGTVEKIIFINDMNYLEMPRPALVYDVAAQASRQHDCIDAWSCRKRRLPAEVTVRDFNPDQPMLDVSSTTPVDRMGMGADYLYGENIGDSEEAGYLGEIRAEERLCNRTRYFGEGSVTRMQTGYLFGLVQHPNQNYNDLEYLVIEVNHSGSHLDMTVSPGNKDHNPAQYRNSFTALEASEQFRPAAVTSKPRFYGTMTGFVFAETGSDMAEIDEFGRYRVHLPFDRADGTKQSSDPERKASTWIRMAQQYVGRDQGSYFPLTGGTEVLLSFINGDPDQPVIIGAVPNASEPSLVVADNSHQHIISTDGMFKLDARGGSKQVLEVNDAAERGVVRGGADDYQLQEVDSADASYTGQPLDEESGDNIVTRRYGHEYIFVDGNTYKWDNEKAFSFGNDYEEIHEDEDGIANGEVFDMGAYMQSIGTAFQGRDGTDRDYTNWQDGGDGLTEKSWGDKCEFHMGRVFCWSGGRGMGSGGALEAFNYGNGYTENLLTKMEKTSEDYTDFSGHKDKWNYTVEWRPHQPDNPARALAYVVGIGTGLATFIVNPLAGVVGGAIRGIVAGVNAGTHETREGLADTWALQPASTAVEKTFGHQYAYHNGLAVEIHEGNTISNNYGDTKEYVSGNSESVVDGDTVATTYGVVSEAFFGSKYEFNLATTDSMTIGLNNEIKIAGDMAFVAGSSVNMFGGVASDTFIGVKNDNCVAASINTNLAAALNLNCSVALNIGSAPEFEVKAGKIVSSELELKNAKSDIECCMLKLFP